MAYKRYIAEDNRSAGPFVWTKPAIGILAGAGRSLNAFMTEAAGWAVY